MGPLISLEQLKIRNSNFARGLNVRDSILYKKCKTSQNGVLPRSSETFRTSDILNVHATEALKNGKIREFIAFDFQHDHQMWTWFVNFFEQKKQKLILARCSAIAERRAARCIIVFAKSRRLELVDYILRTL